MKIPANNPFFKSIVLLASGSFIAQAITALSMPILTRLFSPEQLGVYTYVISSAAIFMSIINGRYDVSIVTEKDEKKIFPLVKLCLLLGCTMAIIGSFFFAIYFFCTDKGVWMAGYIFLILLSYALVDVFTAYNNRNKEYKIISAVYVIRTAAQNGLAILAGFLINSVHCLCLPYSLGLFLGLQKQVMPIKSHLKEILCIPYSCIKKVALEHKKQPLFSAPALLANSLSYSLITIFLESLYGMENVGLYSVSVRLLGLPLAIIGVNVSRVFVEQASKEYNNNGSFQYAFKRTFVLLLTVSIIMVIVLHFCATPICTLVFGKEWADAGVFIKILAPMFGVRFITSAMSPSFVIVGRQKRELFLQFIFLFSNLVSFCVTKISNWGIVDYIQILSILYTFSYIVYLINIYLCSRPIKSSL